jgi:hypothetical protein
MQDSNGSLLLNVKPSQQTQVFTIDFFVSALGGKTSFELLPSYNVKELLFLIPIESPLSIKDAKNRTRKRTPIDFIGRKYIQYVISDFKVGENLTILVSGVKIGRAPLWWIAIFSALALIVAVLCVVWFARRTTNVIAAKSENA